MPINSDELTPEQLQARFNLLKSIQTPVVNDNLNVVSKQQTSSNEYVPPTLEEQARDIAKRETKDIESDWGRPAAQETAFRSILSDLKSKEEQETKERQSRLSGIEPQIPKQLQDVLEKRQYATPAPEKKPDDIGSLISSLQSKAKESDSSDLQDEDEEAISIARQKMGMGAPKVAKSDQSSLEKTLAEAANKDLEERKKYSDLLKDAIAKRDFTQLAAQLGQAASQIGAGITGTVERGVVTKPVGGEIYNKMMDIASQPISDLEKMKAVETEERKNDPNSSESKAARAIMAEFGIKIPETATAAFLEKQFPAISSLMTRRETIEQRREAAKTRAQEMEIRREEIAAYRGKTEQSKIDKDFTKMSEKLTSELASSRSQFGKSASIIRSAEALDASIKNINPKDITTRQIYELARGLDAMLSQGAATISGTKKLIPETYSGDVAKIAEYITRQPKGAGQEAFVKQMMETIALEKRTAQEQVKRTQGKILSGYKHLKQKDPERYEEVLNEFGLSSSKERTSEEKSKSGQKVSSAQLKALVSSKEKNPHGASEAAVARHLINQGFSVEGY